MIKWTETELCAKLCVMIIDNNLIVNLMNVQLKQIKTHIYIYI